MRNHLQTCRITCKHAESLANIQNHLQTGGITCKQAESLANMQNHLQTGGITCKHAFENTYVQMSHRIDLIQIFNYLRYRSYV